MTTQNGLDNFFYDFYYRQGYRAYLAGYESFDEECELRFGKTDDYAELEEIAAWNNGFADAKVGVPMKVFVPKKEDETENYGKYKK